MNVGQIILDQIKTLGFQDMMCWGATKFMTFSEGQLLTIPHMGGLIFKVNGLIHKGHVVVSLNGKDLYDVQIGRLVKGQFISKQSLNDVYAEDLVEQIDNLVEGYYNKQQQRKGA